MLKLQLWFVRVIREHLHPLRKFKLNLVLLWLKISWPIIYGHVIYFWDEAARIARPDTKDKHRPVVGMLVISVKIGDHCYHGLCDMGASVSAIPYSLYEEIITYNVDPIVPTAYIEKPPFPIRIKDHAKATTMVRKSNARTPTPPEQIKV